MAALGIVLIASNLSSLKAVDVRVQVQLPFRDSVPREARNGLEPAAVLTAQPEQERQDEHASAKGDSPV